MKGILNNFISNVKLKYASLKMAYELDEENEYKIYYYSEDNSLFDSKFLEVLGENIEKIFEPVQFENYYFERLTLKEFKETELFFVEEMKQLMKTQKDSCKNEELKKTNNYFFGFVNNKKIDLIDNFEYLVDTKMGNIELNMERAA